MIITKFSLCLALAALLMTGCSGSKELIAEQEAEITRLQKDVDRLESDTFEEKDRSNRLEDDLKNALADLEETEQVCLEEAEGCQRITISDAATFSSGSHTLSAKGKEVIDTVWGVLDEYPDRGILIEGHTDNVPVAPKFRDRFRSNWDLSTARALAVLHYILEKKGTPPERFAVIGYGEERPIADNGTEEGRRKNRRVVITIRDWI